MNFHHATEVALLMKQQAWLDGFQSRDNTTKRIKLLTERGCINEFLLRRAWTRRVEIDAEFL
jgi:uncharacterized protein YecT (DUF1311 family)